MKKLSVLFLSLICALTCTAPFSRLQRNEALATSATEIGTSIVLPESYVEYFSLHSPVDVWTNGTEFAVSESDRIVYFDGTNYKAVKLSELELFKDKDLTSHSVSKIYKVGDYVLFLFHMDVYKLNINDLTVSATGIKTSTTFAVNGEWLLTNSSTSISLYRISLTNGDLAIESEPSSTHNLGYTANKLCINSSGVIFYERENHVYRYSKNRPVALTPEIKAVRSITYADGQIFISAESGIYKMDEEGNSRNLLVSSGSDSSLGKVVDPQGIFFSGGNLYVADKSLNAISEFNLSSGDFTDFFITTNYSGKKRITENVHDLFTDGDTAYVLDEKHLIIIDGNSDKTTALELGEYTGSKIVAATNGTVLLSTGTSLKLLSLTDGVFNETEISGDLSPLKNVSAISTFENDYFLINNETVSNEPKAVIYKLSTKTMKLEYLTAFDGRGDEIATDIFGDIYLSVYHEGIYKVHLTDINATRFEVFTNSNEKILSIFADYEGNLYSLYANDKIVRTSPNGQTQIFSLYLSENLPKTAECVAFAPTDTTKTTYVLYNGFLLSADSDSLNVATPKRITVPENFEITLKENAEFVTVKKEAKFFQVNLDAEYDRYFDYTDISTHTDEKEKFVRITETERYSLIANERIVAIVRTEDLIDSSVTVTAVDKTLYAVNDCNAYFLPIIKNYDKSYSIEKNRCVKVLSALSYNDVDYLLIETDGKRGYVAEKLFKDGVAANLSPDEHVSYTLFKEADYYSDAELSDCVGTVARDEKVKVLKIENGVAEILIDGKAYFISERALEPKGKTVVRNVVLISLCAMTVFVTLVYSAVRLFKSKKIEK